MASRRRRAEAPGILDRVGRTIDRAVLAMAPERGRRRMVARARAALLSATAYQGARTGRLQNAWNTSRGSADQDLLYSGDLEKMRERSRELARNDPHAAAVLRVYEDNVVGCGIRAQARVRREDVPGMTERQAEEWNRRADEAWAYWTEHEADATGAGDFARLQRLFVRTRCVDGEAFVHPFMVRPDQEPGRRFSTAIELVDSDRVATPHGEGSAENIRGGIEIGARGQPIAYHVRKSHPFDHYTHGAPDDYVRVRRFRGGRMNMIHLFRRDRPGQSRGIPLFAPALTMFDHLRNSLEYELVAQRVNASIALFITRSEAVADASISLDDDSDTEQYTRGIEAGMMEELEPGEGIESFNPNRPGVTWDPFVIRVLRAIGAAVGIPYELIARDASDVNYTSSRTLLLEAWRNFRCDQDLLIDGALRPIRALVLTEAYARGDLPEVDGFFASPQVRKALLRATWIPPARGWVDPVKEIQASGDAITLNLSTRSDEAAASGRDFEETARMNAKQLAFLRKLETEYELAPGSLNGATKGATQQEETGDDSDSEEDDETGAEREESEETEEART